jgi:hypothetical protein
VPNVAKIGLGAKFLTDLSQPTPERPSAKTTVFARPGSEAAKPKGVRCAVTAGDKTDMRN